MGLISEGIEALIKGGSRTRRGVQTAGRWSQQALDGMSVGGIDNYTAAVEEKTIFFKLLIFYTLLLFLSSYRIFFISSFVHMCI